MIKVQKRNGNLVDFDMNKIRNAIIRAFDSVGQEASGYIMNDITDYLKLPNDDCEDDSIITVEEIQDKVENALLNLGYFNVAKAYILYRAEHTNIREWTDKKLQFINRYKQSDNTANATVDDNSNVNSKNIGILNSEIHKSDNILINRRMIVNKLNELYPDFESKRYLKDIKSHIIYKNDESSFAGAISPYCCAISMYPFLTDGLKNIGGLSAAPKNLDSYCGMYINMIFAIAAMFAGAVATPEVLLYFSWFARKEWGDDYWQRPDEIISTDGCKRTKTIRHQIHQYFQQIIYSINQPSAARGLQSAFVNFSYFDKPFFDGMFGEFRFPDGSKPIWEALNWLQKEFMQWFNEERLRCILTFPVESFTLLYKDGEFLDKENAEFVAQEYARGHSFFTYISDTVDSLSSCCRLRSKLRTKEFSFTNGNIGIQTGSKSVMTLNLNRIIQNFVRENKKFDYKKFKKYLIDILERVYKYQTAYNELLWDMYNADLLPVYKAGFIDLNKQYLTIGINGLNESAEFIGLNCSNNKDYRKFCTFIFSTIKEQNAKHKTKKTTFNTEQIPAESLAIKNYNWDKQDGYWVPENRNLYASYIFIPSDPDVSILDKIRMHGKEYIGEYLDGGSACHLNLDAHLSVEQYRKILKFAAENECQYFTFNVPNSECDECGFITKVPITECPKCHSKKISYYDRIIGYITKIKNWSKGRQIEQKTRVYEKVDIK